MFCSRKCSWISKIGKSRTIETRKLLSLAHKGTKKPWAGKYKHSDKQKQNVSRSLKKFYSEHPGERIKISVRNKGRKWSPEQREKMKKVVKRGASNPYWKGINASYSAKHKFMYRTKSKTGLCVDCNLVKKTDWSNVDGKYSRNTDDYQERCRVCHIKHDNDLRKMLRKTKKN